MGKIFAKYSSSLANTPGGIEVACPDVFSSGRRIYLHEVSVAPRAANFIADTQVYLSDTYTGEELVTNGAFAADSGWTKGTGWTIAAGKASKAVNALTSLEQEITAPVAGQAYRLKYDLTETASGITPSFAGFTFGADAGTGSQDELALAASTEATLGFLADATAIVDIDNVSLKKVFDPTSIWLHDNIRAATTDRYVRTFNKQPWSTTGWSLYCSTGGAACILDMVMIYEVV